VTSRFKLLLAVLVGLVVALTAVLVWTLTRPPAASAPAQPVSTPAPTFNPSAGDAHDEEDHASDPALDQEAAWRPVVEHFARGFTDTSGGARSWRTRLTGDRTPPYVTEEVAQQLATVDVGNVPKGRYDTYEVVKSTAYDVAVRVDYREGWSMVLYLNTDGTNWQVYAYDKYEE